MRIIGGEWKGRTIVPPKNLRARPTTDFAKENLFNILINSYDFPQMDILDLFSGTGSISMEFLSRGAHSVTSIEINAIHQAFIASTGRLLGAKNLYSLKANAFLYLKSTPKKFDLIFSDAPYDLKGSDAVIDIVFERKLLNTDGILIFEHSDRYDFSKHPNFEKLRKYGSVHFSFFRDIE
ncbi:MAG: RsmD family RNA methyltransferase [Alistipes sp.]|nr:RsmD family RNA methyltransferase [Candidatus Alistipes equi]